VQQLVNKNPNKRIKFFILQDKSKFHKSDTGCRTFLITPLSSTRLGHQREGINKFPGGGGGVWGGGSISPNGMTLRKAAGFTSLNE